MPDDKLLAMARLAVELYEGLPPNEEGNEAAQLINDGILQMETGQVMLRIGKPDTKFNWGVRWPRRMIHAR
jgi:hypothetical protein